MQQFREVTRTRTTHSTETHTSDFTDTENTNWVRVLHHSMGKLPCFNNDRKLVGGITHATPHLGVD